MGEQTGGCAFGGSAENRRRRPVTALEKGAGTCHDADRAAAGVDAPEDDVGVRSWRLAADIV